MRGIGRCASGEEAAIEEAHKAESSLHRRPFPQGFCDGLNLYKSLPQHFTIPLFLSTLSYHCTPSQPSFELDHPPNRLTQ